MKKSRTLSGALIVVAVLAVACGGPEPTPTPSRSPTTPLTSGPTATPTPIPSPVADSTSQPSMKKEVKDLIAVIPADYDVAVFMNVRTILEDPNLKEVLTRSGALRDLDLVVGSSEHVKGGEIMYHLGGRALRCGV